MERVAVVGPSGSGKTTFARHLAARLGVPHVELDALYWTEPGWREPPRDAFRERVARATAGPRWVTDGNYLGKLDLTLWGRADTLVWLDLPLAVCAARLVRRGLARALSREPLWGGNRETVAGILADPASPLRYTLATHRRRRARFAALLAEDRLRRLTVHRFASSAEAERWLAGVGGVSGGAPGT